MDPRLSYAYMYTGPLHRSNPALVSENGMIDAALLASGNNERDHGPHSPISSFPEEVFDMIFDLIRRVDRRKWTLAACRQVSRHWRNMTLKHFYYSLSLVYRVEGQTSIITCFVQDFIQDEIFDSTKRFVRNLALRCGTGDSPITEDAIRYISFFPVLRHLKFTGVVKHRLPKAMKLEVPPSLNSLSLDTDKSHSYEVRALCDLLCLLPTIRTLRLEVLHHHGRAKTMPTCWDEWSTLPEISTLMLQSMYPDPVFDALLKHTSLFNALTSVDLVGGAGDTSMGSFVCDNLAGQLEHLSYAIDIKTGLDGLLYTGK